MDRNAPTVAEAVRQTKPFDSSRQEGVIALVLTAEAVRWRFGKLLATHGELTPQQYNVLRILRGAGPKGLPTLSIVERMIENTPGITRLIDRLEAKRLVRRERDGEDRRQVVCRITPQGLAVLKKFDPVVNDAEHAALGSLNDQEVVTLIRLLNKIRTQRP